MSANAKKSLARFLSTLSGQLAVACFIGVRSTNHFLRTTARANASLFCPRKRNWTISDLIDEALTILPSGVYAAKEVTL